MQTPTVSPSGQSVGSAHSCTSSGATELLSSPPDLPISNGYRNTTTKILTESYSMYGIHLLKWNLFVVFCYSVHNFTSDHFDLQHNLSTPIQSTTLPASNHGWGGESCTTYLINVLIWSFYLTWFLFLSRHRTRDVCIFSGWVEWCEVVQVVQVVRYRTTTHYCFSDPGCRCCDVQALSWSPLQMFTAKAHSSTMEESYWLMTWTPLWPILWAVGSLFILAPHVRSCESFYSVCFLILFFSF